MISIATNSPGRFAGLTLKAWAVIDGAGALVRGFNVTSTSCGTSNYTVTHTTALSTLYPIMDIGVNSIGGAGQISVQYSLRSLTAPIFQILVNGVASQLNANFYIAFYE